MTAVLFLAPPHAPKRFLNPAVLLSNTFPGADQVQAPSPGIQTNPNQIMNSRDNNDNSSQLGLLSPRSDSGHREAAKQEGNRRQLPHERTAWKQNSHEQRGQANEKKKKSHTPPRGVGAQHADPTGTRGLALAVSRQRAQKTGVLRGGKPEKARSASRKV